MTEDINSTPATYSTLEEIRLRKEMLSDAIDRDSEKMGALWSQLFVKRENASKGEYIAGLVANSVTAIDAFLLVRKLLKTYGGIMNLFTRGSGKKKKKR